MEDALNGQNLIFISYKKESEWFKACFYQHIIICIGY